MTRLPAALDAIGTQPLRLYDCRLVYTDLMAKHLIDLDEPALAQARVELGTTTIKDTVNEALRRASIERDARVRVMLDRLATADLGDRADAWR